MQKTVYTCDHCNDVIGQVPHVSIQVHSNGGISGIALPPKSTGNENEGFWRVKNFPTGFFHLHIKCATPFFKKQAEKHTVKPKAK